jgi:anti-sigma regulatory factor (Ser/Thr protein kinase)
VLVSGLVRGVDVTPEHAEARVHGELRLGTAGDLQRSLVKLLAGHQHVLVDLAQLTLAWRPAVQSFATALGATEGWPSTRLVLFGADPEMARALTALRVTRTVPLAIDRAAAVARLRERPDLVVRRTRLHPVPTAPRVAREFVARACADWGVAEAALPARYVVNELVANVVQHAGTVCDVEVRLDAHGLWVETRDYRPGPAPRPRPRLLGGNGGRGLHVVTGLAERFGSFEQADGKRVWALLATGTA